MKYIEIPEFPVLHGEKAIQALYEFISELEAQRGKELTEKQTDALIKVAKGLISSIKTEEQSHKGTKKPQFVLCPLNSPMQLAIGTTPYWYALPKSY